MVYLSATAHLGGLLPPEARSLDSPYHPVVRAALLGAPEISEHLRIGDDTCRRWTNVRHMRVGGTAGSRCIRAHDGRDDGVVFLK
jgi:hypothetical protein